MKNKMFAAGGMALLCLAGTPCAGSDFGPLLDVVRSTWPERTRIGVITDFGRSRAEIGDLARAAGEGCEITVVDLRNPDHFGHAVAYLVSQVKPDYCVLMPRDSSVFDGSPYAGALVRQAALNAIPTIATTARALHQGAVFAMGPGTGMDLLVTEQMIGTVEVTLPQRGTYIPPVARLGPGPAAVRVLAGP